MEQKDWLVLPAFVCRSCGVLLEIKATEKRPVSEFYVLHPSGICPLSNDGVKIDSDGNYIEKIEI